jgi:hypothetical protein
MKKRDKYIFLTAGLLFFAWIARARAAGSRTLTKTAKKTKMLFSNFASPVREKLAIIEDSIRQTGAPEDRIKWLLAQVLHETGVFTAKSKVAELNNNFSGIKWLNKKHQIATKGSPVPPGERVRPASSPINFYAKFETPADWARDYYRIVSTFGTKPIINATDLKDYVKRLKQNKYFGGPETVYFKAMTKFLEKLD